jgi:hypothetical protein
VPERFPAVPLVLFDITPPDAVNVSALPGPVSTPTPGVNPLTLVAAIVPLPVVDKDAPMPTTMFAVVFVPVVIPEKAAPLPEPHGAPVLPSVIIPPLTEKLAQDPFVGVPVNVAM